MADIIGVCLLIRVCTWVCTTYKAIFSFFLFITQIILIVFFSGQINHLYDVYNNFIIEKHAVYND